jgi:hypothetical protein
MLSVHVLRKKNKKTQETFRKHKTKEVKTNLKFSLQGAWFATYFTECSWLIGDAATSAFSGLSGATLVLPTTQAPDTIVHGQ